MLKNNKTDGELIQ